MDNYLLSEAVITSGLEIALIILSSDDSTRERVLIELDISDDEADILEQRISEIMLKAE
jgi:hypothetical protein